MAFGKFRPVLTPGAELGSDGAGAGSAPMTQRSDVTRSDLQRPDSETVIAARGLRVSYGDFEALRGIDLEVSRGRNSTPIWHRHRSTTSLASKYIRVAEMRGLTSIGTTRGSSV